MGIFKRNSINDESLKNMDWKKIFNICEIKKYQQEIEHSDGRINSLILIGFNEKKQKLLKQPTKWLGFEIEKNRQLDNMDNVIEYVMKYYLKKYNRDKICQFMGEYTENGGFISSPSIAQAFDDTIAKDLELEISEKMEKYVKSKERDSTINRIQLCAKEIDKLNQEEEKKKYRINFPFLKNIKESFNENNDKLIDYNGVNIVNGDILKLRNILKVGKDENNNYLYSGYILETKNEKTLEQMWLSKNIPLGRFICFEIKNRRLEDIVERGNPDEIRQVLYLLSFENKKQYENNGKVNYIGSLDECGNVERANQSKSKDINNAISNIAQSMEKEK